MRWENPPKIKIYEALGAIADKRVELSGSTAKIFSSSGKKHYHVSYDKESNSIMANDNSSFYTDHLGYPAIAFLLLSGEVGYEPTLADKLKGFAWKDINQEFKNDFEKTLKFVLAGMTEDEKNSLANEVQKIGDRIANMELNLLGDKVKPPQGY